VPTGALFAMFAEWRENIKIGTRAAMQRPEVLDKVRCSARRHLMPPKKEKPVSPFKGSPVSSGPNSVQSRPVRCSPVRFSPGQSSPVQSSHGMWPTAPCSCCDECLHRP
jgi:hypothetical protein